MHIVPTENQAYFKKVFSFVVVLNDFVQEKLRRPLTEPPIFFESEGKKCMECHYDDLEFVFVDGEKTWKAYIIKDYRLHRIELDFDIIHVQAALAKFAPERP